MYYCQRCSNEVLKAANFCDSCGYRLANARTQAAQPPTPQSHGLIRPIGASYQQKRTTNHALPARPEISTIDSPRSGLPSQLVPSTSQVQKPLLTQAQPGMAQPLLPIEDMTTGHFPAEVAKGRPQSINTQERFGQFDGDESFVATSIAAEHWRTSWRNRQRTEAGPATIVSRGHSLVPEPLLAMQHSLLRMRAIISPKNAKQHTGPGFWITIVLMICLIGGLGAYIFSTYLPIAGW